MSAGKDTRTLPAADKLQMPSFDVDIQEIGSYKSLHRYILSSLQCSPLLLVPSQSPLPRFLLPAFLAGGSGAGEEKLPFCARTNRCGRRCCCRRRRRHRRRDKESPSIDTVATKKAGRLDGEQAREITSFSNDPLEQTF
jgi:hypothetical protein